MRKKFPSKRLLFFLIWLLTLGVICFYPFDMQLQSQLLPATSDQSNTSVLINFSYYVQKEGRSEFELFGSRMELDQQKSAKVWLPRGKMFNDEDKEINFESRQGRFKNDDAAALHLEGAAHVFYENSVLKANEIHYFPNDDSANGRGHVFSSVKFPETRELVTIHSERFVAQINNEIVSYHGGVNGSIARKRSFEKPLIFESEELVLDKPEHKIELKRSVYLKKNSLEIWSKRGELFLENFNRKLKYYVLFDDVRLVETYRSQAGVSSQRKAFSEKLEGFAKQKKMILTGTPRVLQKGDEIRGYQITLYEQTGLIEVDDSISYLKKEPKN